MRKVFLVSGEEEAADYESVSRLLGNTTAIFIQHRRVTVTHDGELPPIIYRAPRVSLALCGALLKMLGHLRRHHEQFALITGQDIGTCQRLAISYVRRNGLPVVLLQHGILFASDSTSTRNSSWMGHARALFDHTGLLAGDGVRVGASDPDTILSWGEGWAHLWRTHAPHADVVCVGSPRTDRFGPPTRSSPGCRVLLCSQPFWEPGFKATATDLSRWYRWLFESAQSLSDDVEVRVRLHPGELARMSILPLPPGFSTFVVREPVRDALFWATHVVAPASTISLEAAARTRKVALVHAIPSLHRTWDASPLFAALGWTRLATDNALTLNDLDFSSPSITCYLANVGSAANAAATVLFTKYGI